MPFLLQQWNRLDVRGAKVSVRAYHAACCLVGPLTGQEDPLVVVVGGMGKGHTVLNEVLLLGIDEYRRWDQVKHQSLYFRRRSQHCEIRVLSHKNSDYSYY